ncbi:hypothetical protein [Caminibacter mediatlanticus]|uniref:Uncharacterized protein n=1 Tax=Caminibacter mediatlanticus TB-2 TaxID=391592 RepID=A0AAI9AI01_9BACT|nr:hypothetical protein [Caminibacter mediatlanticus]EDM24023.1 hypothetical protein CMTB2_07206 [Caminibacter mediatlanticus TB-2]
MRISIGNLPLKNIKADIFMHPIKYKDSIIYEPMSEEAVIALITKHFTYDNVPEYIKDYFDEMDDGYLFSESNFDEFDLEKLEVGTLLIGRDIAQHPRVENIKKFLAILRDFGGFKIEGIDIPQFFSPSDPELAEIVETEKKFYLEDIAELESFDGSVVYACIDPTVVKGNELLCSYQFVIANKIKSEKVKIFYCNEDRCLDEVKEIKKDINIKGTFGIILKKVDDYPFLKVEIRNL